MRPRLCLGMIVIAQVLVLPLVPADAQSGGSEGAVGAGDVPNAGRPENDEASRAADLLEGVWNSIEQLRTGVVRIHEDTQIETQEETTDYFFAFDFENGCLRLDRRTPSRASFTQYARNERETLVHVGAATHARLVHRYPRDFDDVVRGAKPIDFRAAGVMLWPTLRSAMPLSWTKDLFERIPADARVSVTDEENTVRVSWEYPLPGENQENHFALVLDRNVELRPIVFQTEYRQGEELEGKEWIAASRTETTWVAAGDTWVPQTARLAGVHNEALTVLSFDWQIVNDSVPPTLFELEGLDLPEKTLVVNETRGEKIIEGTIGERRARAAETAERPRIDEPRSRTWVWINLAVVAALLVCGACARMRGWL